MRSTCALALLALLVLAGCRVEAEVDPDATVGPRPATELTVDEMRRLAPNAIIGRVVAVAPAERLVMIEIPTEELQAGRALSIAGADARTLAVASIQAIENGNARARFEPVRGAERNPVVGDVAVHFRD